jgi:oligopeptide transport system permease protein
VSQHTSAKAAPIATLRAAKVERRSGTLQAIRRFRRNKLAMAGFVFLMLLGLVALLADILAPYSYSRAFLTLRANLLPFVNPDHILGLDGSSRDYLSRLIFGARTSLQVGLTVPIISFLIGVPLGAVSGYVGGRVDFVIQRIVEVATAIPPLLFALFLLSVLGTGVNNVIIVLSVTSWIESTRLTRAQVLSLKERESVTSARALGAGHGRIILHHILPGALSPLMVLFSFSVPLAIFSEAGLSFLGIGITEPTPSWGKMLGSGIGTSIRVYYHIALFPTLLVALTMLAFSFVGDGLQEALDPTRSRTTGKT